jgi:hypothetical protein
MRVLRDGVVPPQMDLRNPAQKGQKRREVPSNWTENRSKNDDLLLVGTMNLFCKLLILNNRHDCGRLKTYPVGV